MIVAKISTMILPFGTFNVEYHLRSPRPALHTGDIKINFPLNFFAMDRTNRPIDKLRPKVIACGYRHVQTKTGNYFPAFLIRLPRLDAIINEADEQSNSSYSYRYVWRTKRDFLLVSI